jgi:hypothetical protein
VPVFFSHWQPAAPQNTINKNEADKNEAIQRDWAKRIALWRC